MLRFLYPVVVMVLFVLAACHDHATTTPGEEVTTGPEEGVPIEETTQPPATYMLYVVLESEDFGTGRVGSDPEGIACPVDCSKDFASGAAVVLNARPYPDVVLKEWTGCTELVAGEVFFPDCKVVMDSDKTVTAVFKRTTSPTPPRTLPELDLRPRIPLGPRIDIPRE